MADTVYEKMFNRYVAFTRFWMGNRDAVQISVHDTYVSMPIEEFRKAYKAIEESVEKNKDAWWVKLSKVNK